MTVRKLDYAQPDCELLYVRFEENILSGKPITPWEPDNDELE